MVERKEVGEGKRFWKGGDISSKAIGWAVKETVSEGGEKRV